VERPLQLEPGGIGSQLDGMYVIVAESLATDRLTGSHSGLMIRRCANEAGRRVFSTTDPRKLYHEPRCASAQAARKYRRRQKSEA
jgi:hypothetical protein